MSQANNFALTSTHNHYTTSNFNTNLKTASISHDSVRVTTPNEKVGIKEIDTSETANASPKGVKKKKNLRLLLRSCRKRNAMLQKRNDAIHQLLLQLRKDNVLTDLYVEKMRESFPEAVSILKEMV